ncbi:hypothetical protein PI125_g12635 [Phytophthora idaei]|nr:hypothetical protein PI125_g12635 [Phytophthora idaei]
MDSYLLAKEQHFLAAGLMVGCSLVDFAMVHQAFEMPRWGSHLNLQSRSAEPKEHGRN